MPKTILHSDLNNFFASVECKDNPELLHVPMAVCGSKEKRHGIVLAKNYPAKAYGIKTGEPIWEAVRKCPRLVTVPPRFSLYIEYSEKVRQIYRSYTSLIEPFGIDECWLDVTASEKLFGPGDVIANTIRERVKKETGITVSVGVSFNKIFAKLGSDLKKPDAVTVISEHDYKDIIWPLPIQELLYVGRATRRRLNDIGIHTIGELAMMPYRHIGDYMGKYGQTLWFFANGRDESAVREDGRDSVIKSIGNSTTTPRDLTCMEDIKAVCYLLGDSVGKRLRIHGLKGRTVQIYIRDVDLGSITRQGFLDHYTCSSYDISEKAIQLFRASWYWHKKIRSLGLKVTDLREADGIIQPTLWGLTGPQKREDIDYSLDDIRKRYGYYSVRRALLMKSDLAALDPEKDHTIHPLSYFR
jgi:DNA polymerase IV